MTDKRTFREVLQEWVATGGLANFLADADHPHPPTGVLARKFEAIVPVSAEMLADAASLGAFDREGAPPPTTRADEYISRGDYVSVVKWSVSNDQVKYDVYLGDTGSECDPGIEYVTRDEALIQMRTAQAELTAAIVLLEHEGD